VSRAQRGYTYIGLLIAVAVAGIALAATGEVWSTQARREREEQLLFAGEQFRQAITSYFESTPGGTGQFPRNIEDLIEDRRLPTVRRHLRQIYADPIAGGSQWGLVRAGPNNTITGVYSLAPGAPIKRQGFRREQEAFANAATYADWKFVYLPRAATGGNASPASRNR
jgi:type II secretory pathway pseudopilin PulG